MDKNMEIDKIYNIDCLEGMKHIPDGSIDAIICDLPYGTMKGSGKWDKMGMKGDQHDWDEIIPTDPKCNGNRHNCMKVQYQHLASL